VPKQPQKAAIHERVGERLRLLRKKKGWKLEYVEAHAGLDKAHLSRIETGKIEPTLRILEILTESYGVSMVDLFREI
jgi:transcriptional regulator with XRE-family HTH domain